MSEFQNQMKEAELAEAHMLDHHAKGIHELVSKMNAKDINTLKSILPEYLLIAHKYGSINNLRNKFDSEAI